MEQHNPPPSLLLDLQYPICIEVLGVTGSISPELMCTTQATQLPVMWFVISPIIGKQTFSFCFPSLQWSLPCDHVFLICDEVTYMCLIYRIKEETDGAYLYNSTVSVMLANTASSHHEDCNTTAWITDAFLKEKKIQHTSSLTKGVITKQVLLLITLPLQSSAAK